MNNYTTTVHSALNLPFINKQGHTFKGYDWHGKVLHVVSIMNHHCRKEYD